MRRLPDSPPLRARGRRFIAVTGSSALAIAAVALVLFATANGAGVSPDSTVYIAGARSLAAGQGFTAPKTRGPVAITHFPPLYPAALALLTPLGLDPLDASRPVNAALFGAYVLLAGCLVWSATGSALGAITASAASLVSAPLLEAHVMALSEPLFLLLGLGVIGTLARYRGMGAEGVGTAASAPGETSGAMTAACAGVLAALAILTRYAGFALVPGGAVAILAARPFRRARLRDAAVYMALALGPAALWGLRNRGRGIAGYRVWGFYPLGSEDLRRAWRTVAGWVAPGSAAADAIALGLGLGVVVLGVAAARARRPGVRPSAALTSTTALVVTSYVAFVIAARLVFDADIPLEQRILSPVYAWGLIAVVAALTDFEARGWARFVRPAGFAILALIGASHLAFSAAWATHVRQSGLGYNSAAWRASPTLAAVRQLPAGTSLYSNGDDVVLLLTGRLARRIPSRTGGNVQLENLDYAAEMSTMRRQLACADAVIVLLPAISWRWYLPSEEELQLLLPLRLVRREADGAIYASAEECSE